MRRKRVGGSTPARPPGIPPGAVWNAGDGEWQLGTTVERGKRRKETVRVGEWRCFSPEGRLLSVAHFDDEGFEDGVVERFHPDGTLASRGEWRHGSRSGHFVFVRSSSPTRESYPADPRTWRYEHDSEANWEEHGERWFLEDGTECTADGRPLATAFDLDEAIGAAAPDGYLAVHAEDVRRAFGAAAPPPPDASDPLWGPLPQEVLRYLATATGGDSFAPVTHRRTFEGNVWRSLVAHPWDNVHEELGAVLMGAIRIGTFGDSDGVYATLFRPRRTRPAPNAVYLWSHETYHVDAVIARSLDDFAFSVAVAGAFDAQRLSRTAARAAWRKLAGRTSAGSVTAGLSCLTDPEDGEELDEEPPPRESFAADLDPDLDVRGPYFRGQWILKLLEADAARSLGVVRECFVPELNPALDDGAFLERVARGRDVPSLAVYLAWRSFWFAQQDRLAACREAYGEHAAPVVRDLVALLAEVEAGSAAIGGIADLFSVRRAFLELDLCPEGSATREAAALAEGAARAERAASLAARARARAMEAAAAGIEPLLDLAWSRLDEAVELREFERVARTFPGHELAWRSLDWVRARGYRRADVELREEAVDVGAWLGRHGCRVVQPFLWGLLDEEPAPAALLLPAIGRTPGALDPRLVPALLARLHVVEEYHHKRALAVDLLAAAGAREALPRLRALLGEHAAAVAGPGGEAVASRFKVLLASVAAALRRFADPPSPEAPAVRAELGALANHLAATRELELAGDVVAAAVAWGESRVGRAVRAVVAFTDEDARLDGLRLAEAMAGDPGFREAFTGIALTNPAPRENAATLLYQRVLLAFAREAPEPPEGTMGIDEAMELARELGSYGTDRWIAWRVVECETVGRFRELDLDGIAHHLRSPHARVREAARDAFAARGVPPPPERALPWPEVLRIVDAAPDTEDAVRAVAAAMAAPDAAGRAPAAAWLREHPSATGAAALAAVVGAELDRFRGLGAGEDLAQELRWLVRALARHAAHAVALPVIERCLATGAFRDSVVTEVEHLPSSLAPRLVALAAERDGWARAAIARWLLSRDDQETTAALAAARIGKRKLRTWAG